MKEREKMIEKHLEEMEITKNRMSIAKELFLAMLPIAERLEDEEMGVDEVRHFIIMVGRAVAMRRGPSRGLKF